MKEWIYIVSWTLITVWYGSPSPTVDEYGRISLFVYAVAVAHTDTTFHTKRFSDRLSAFEFYEKTIKANYEDIVNVKIDSLLIEQP